MTTDAAGARQADVLVRLFEQHQREIYTYLCRMVRDGEWAADLAQETFLRALRARQSLREIDNPRAWLYRIATNLALNGLKRRRRFSWLPWREAGEGLTGRSDTLEALGERNRVEAALAALPPELRAPLLLYAHDGLSVAEVAEVLNLGCGAVKMRLYRARMLFRSAWDGSTAGEEARAPEQARRNACHHESRGLR